MENLSINFVDKICGLLNFLRRTREEFELVSEEMDDDHVRMTIRGLALETSQYEQELKSQMNTLEIKHLTLPGIFNYEELLKSIHSIIYATSIREILDTCTKTESFFEREYRTVLNEYFPYQSLRDVLVYQLNSLKCTFMKMKLLNSIH